MSGAQRGGAASGLRPRQGPRPGSLRRAAPALCAALLVEALVVWRAAWMGAPTGLDLGFLAAGHLLAAVFGAEALQRRYPGARRDEEDFYAWGLALGGGVPVLGVLGVLWLSLRPPPADASEQAIKSPERVRQERAAQVREEDAEARTATLDVQALAEALEDPEAQARLAAIDTLRGMQGPKAVALLKAARDNSLFDVRYRAVEALGEFGQRYADRIRQATKAVDKRSDVPETHLDLADLYWEYRGLGLEEGQMQEALLSDAHQHYREAVELGCTNPRAIISLSECLVALGWLDDAWAVLHSRPDWRSDPEVLLALARIQFRAGAVGPLRTTAREALEADAGALSEEARSALQTWVAA